MEKDCCFISDGVKFRYRSAAIIMADNCVLLAKNDRDNYYYSVGGGVHLYETAQEAVIREVKEETGVDYEVERLAFVHENFFKEDEALGGNLFHEISFYFLMKNKGDKHSCENGLGVTDTGIKEHMHWVPIDKLGKINFYPKFFIEELKNLPKGIKHIVTKEKI